MNNKEKVNPQEQWMVVKTNPRAEKKVDERLVNAGFTTFLPLVTTLKIWSDRKKKVEHPLIPSTLFICTFPELLKDVYSVNGVHSILKFLGEPAIVQEYEIENLRILLNQKDESDIKPVDQYQKGEMVKVLRGPFQGLIANIMKTASSFRLVVEIESLGSGFVVNVPKSYVQKWNDVNS